MASRIETFIGSFSDSMSNKIQFSLILKRVWHQFTQTYLQLQAWNRGQNSTRTNLLRQNPTRTKAPLRQKTPCTNYHSNASCSLLSYSILSQRQILGTPRSTGVPLLSAAESTYRTEPHIYFVHSFTNCDNVT